MSLVLEETEEGFRDEPAPGREQVRVAMAMLLATEKPKMLDQMQVKLARVMATPRTRCSSICSGLPDAMSDGMQPSARFKIKTTSHSCPLAE